MIARIEKFNGNKAQKISLLGINPVAKERARTGKFGGTYTPINTRTFEAAVKEAVTALDPILFSTALQVDFFLLLPRMNKHKDSVFVMTTPDFDNLGKSACDALNKICWTDDRIIQTGCSTKTFFDVEHEDYCEASVIIAMKELPPDYNYIRDFYGITGLL